MNRKMAIIGLCACVGCHASGWSRTETTHGKEEGGFAASRTNMILAIQRTNGGVRIHSNGHYVRSTSAETPYQSLTNDFFVAIGEEFQMAPDHHASARFVVQAIDDDGITVKYESSFDHRSFGKDLITRDVGRFRWPYSDKD